MNDAAARRIDREVDLVIAGKGCAYSTLPLGRDKEQ
jgi:hypothetical protein